MPTKFSKYQIATAIAVLFHAVGIIGIVFLKDDAIIRSTPLHLLLMLALLIWTQNNKNYFFVLFLIASIAIGITVEIIGANTKLLFGDYSYGAVLGPQIKNVPLIVGVNWFIIIYCCGISIHTLLSKAVNKLSAETATPPMALKALSIIVDGATLAVFFDWLMEPVAVQLGYWKWEGGIPFYNYLCWFIVSIILLAIFHWLNFSKQNKFAVHLLMIQVMFFLLLRTFYR